MRSPGIATCGKCDREIDLDEYVNNWGWCASCLDNDYTAYLAETPGPPNT